MSIRCTWQQYFVERRNRRIRRLLFNVLGAPVSFVGGMTLFAKNIYMEDPTATILGVESGYLYSMGAVGVAALSASMAPLAFEALWRIINPEKSRTIDAMDRTFLARIQKYRAPPKFSIQAGDFYGEKITSIGDYRSWLRKQRYPSQ